MELEFEGKEINVGSFHADILCKNEDDAWVLIENQLEETNHDHLGKILTYSAGLNAQTVIWIAKKFREEHRAALDRQNEITDERFQYFGIEIKVWKIEDSVPAPEFDIVSKPIEAIENPSKRFVIGVQYHPERMLQASELREHGQKLFEAFIHAASQ